MAQRADEAVRGSKGEHDSERSRDRILAAALEEFASKGFEGTTTAEIARRAGVTQPLVHYHFESKDELWRTTVLHLLDAAEATFGGVLAELSDLDHLDKLKVLVRRLVYFSATHPEFGRILAYEGAKGGERLSWLLAQQPASEARLFVELLESAAQEGVLKPLPMAHVAACIGAASAYVFVIREMMRTVYGIDVDDPTVIDAHANTVVELFFHGMTVEDASARSGTKGAA
ncbi:MAG: TetR/AcrR family transcriptional regulator [Acidimicrobiales bacterium]|nr:TetR/AcrR family transcriptional regulator [Acidimicrobiales bacterium]